MNGGRGAKGSIKDRIISMLYRLRYKKKELKEENYTIDKKEEQIQYLNVLEDFKDNEGVNILDSSDKVVLDSIEYEANFKISNKLRVDTLNKDKKLIEPLKEKVTNGDLELNNIEPKSSELVENSDLKKESKKTKEEIIILKEVDDFVRKSIDVLDEISVELNEIKSNLKEKKEEEIIKNKYNELRKKISKLKNQYDAIKDKYDLSEFSIIQSIKIMDSIESYKSIATLNEIEMMIMVCRKEIDKIDSITIINDESKKVGKDIENKKDNDGKIKVKFNKSKEIVNDMKNTSEELFLELKEQQGIIDEMYSKASYYEKEVTKKLEYIGYRKILSSLFKITGGILTIPLTGSKIFGVALGSTMISKGLKEMNKGLEKRERIIINYKYEDISSQISNVKDKLEYTSLILTDSLNEIKKLKNNFNDIFSEYEYILPDYPDIIEKINSLENMLLEQQFKLNKMDKKLDEERELNKQKLKKVCK